MIPIICIVGKQGSGKTYVMTKLVTEIKNREYRVGKIKHSSHDFEIDHEGKDTWQHTQAGSDSVIISSPFKVALINKVDHDASLPELSRLIDMDFDIILAEGFKKSNAPKIEVHRKEQGADLICAHDELLAIISDERLDSETPQFGAEDAEGIVNLIEKRYINKAGKDKVSLFINGEPIPLNRFVQGMFYNTLFGMISSLKRIPRSLLSATLIPPPPAAALAVLPHCRSR